MGIRTRLNERTGIVEVRPPRPPRPPQRTARELSEAKALQCYVKDCTTGHLPTYIHRFHGELFCEPCAITYNAPANRDIVVLATVYDPQERNRCGNCTHDPADHYGAQEFCPGQ